MKRLLASVALIVAASALSGCYYDPGYSYVRSQGYGGDAYYGDGGNAYYAAPGYYDGYYGNSYYGSGYYGYSPGVSVGISSGWYGGSRYRHDDDRGHRDYQRHAGQWQGRHDGDGRSHGGNGGPQRQSARPQGQQPLGDRGHGGDRGSRGDGHARGDRDRRD